jgi:hypothetical protein
MNRKIKISLRSSNPDFEVKIWTPFIRFFFNERNYILETKLCGRCHKPVPASFSTDDVCRHCGKYWCAEDVLNSGSSTNEQSSKTSSAKVVITLVALGIIIALVALGLTKYLNNKLLAESLTAGSAVRESLALYAADDENNLYPQEIENWSDLVYICNLNTTSVNAPLKFTGEAQGMSFRKYKTIDGRRSYFLWLEVRGIPKDTKGKILEISPSGIEKLTAKDLQE